MLHWILLLVGTFALPISAQESEEIPETPPPNAEFYDESNYDRAERMDQLNPSRGEENASRSEKKSRTPTDATTEPAATGEEAPEKKWQPPKQKKFSAAQIAAECRKFEGKYISFYDEVYKVESCKRRRIKEHDELNTVAKQDVANVGAETIIMLSEGKIIAPMKQNRSCAELEGHYAIYEAEDIYYIENCKLRMFPDWETYEAHQEERTRAQTVMIELSEEEYRKLGRGKPIPTIMDKVFKDLLEGVAGIDVIPIDEACRGVNEKYVAYYSYLYRIENCRKRAIKDPEKFLRVKTNSTMKFIELTSEQWLSLPEGKPWAF